jgi:hypothetical protein
MMISKTKLMVILLIVLLSVSASANYWEFLGLSGMRVLSIETDPINPQYICAGTDSGLYVSSNSGQSWDHQFANLNVPFLSYNPYDNDTLWALLGGGSWSDGIHYSIDNGTNWWPRSYMLNPRRLGFDPVNPGFMYICFEDGILKSQDSFQTYSSANTGLPDLNIIDIKGDGSNQLEAYAVGETFIAYTTDFANNWEDIGGLFGLEDYNPNRIEYEPNGPETLYVSCWAYVAISFNGGLDWEYTSTITTDNVPIACDPQVAGRLFVGSASGGGVLISTDAGATFIPFNDSLGNLNIHSLEIDANGRLLAGTEDGIYIYDFSSDIVDNDPIIPSSATLYQNYPNPFNNQTLIEFTFEGSGNVRVEIYDIAGRLVKVLFDGPVNSYQSLWWNGTDKNGDKVSSGLYVYSLKTPDQAIFRKMTFLK